LNSLFLRINTYDEVGNIRELEGILQRGGVFNCGSSSDGIVSLERNRSQEVDAAKDTDFRSDL
jgi:transcriptional regulator with GAF, ATPase, and Fis domain